MSSSLRPNWKAYEYTPTEAGAVITCVLFALATITCITQFIIAISRAKYSSRNKVLTVTPFILGGLFETVGYLGRILSLNDPTLLNPYIMQSLLLLVAPLLFAASIYMTLGHIIHELDADHYSIIPLKWLTKIFVVGDILAFFVQAGGGGVIATSTSANSALSPLLGSKIIIGGMFLQILSFGFFIMVMSIFQIRIYRNPTCISQMTRRVPNFLRNWQVIIITLFFCSIMIFIRSVVRAIGYIDYIEGIDSSINSHEIFMYGFDGLLMFLQMIAFCLEDVAGYFSIYEERVPISCYVDIDLSGKDKV